MRRHPQISALLTAMAVFGAVVHLKAEPNALPLPDHPRYAIEHFGERFGLGSATVTSLAQDAQGFLWIGTQTGVQRYDGAVVKRFGREEGLPGEVVTLVLAAPDGHIWVRTRKGISRFDHERFSTVYSADKAEPLRDVYQSFAVDASGTLYVSTQGGLLRVGRSRLESNFESPVVFPNLVDAIVCAPDGTLWFASGESIGSISGGSTKPDVPSPLPLRDDRVMALLPTGDHRLWIRTSRQIGLLDTRKPGSLPTWFGEDLPGANAIGGPNLDRLGNLLLPTSKGLYQRVGNSWKTIDHRSGLTSSAVTAVLEDREGEVWIGTAGAGLDHWPGSKQWSGWTDAEGLSDALVLGVVRDQRARLWVATNSALTLWDPEKRQWKNWTGDGLAGAGARQVLLASDGAIWALFPSKGLFRFDAYFPNPHAQRAPIPTAQLPRVVSVAPTGLIWADGTRTLHTIAYKGGHFIAQEEQVPESIGSAEHVSVSPHSVLWAAGPKGLSRRVNMTWEHLNVEKAMLSTHIANLRAVRDNEVWVGYPDEGAITGVRVASDSRPIINHFPKGVCSLGSDARQNVWLEMEEGAGVVSPEGMLTTFTQRDGLLWNDLNCDALWQESDGTLLIGTSKGLARYDPKEQPQELPQPTTVLTSAIFGKSDRLEDLDPQVEYDDRTFQAHFAAPIFRDPDHVSCRYRLRGLETEYTETTLREVRYPSLPSGSYSFEVSCGSATLGWSEAAEYSFEIHPPWWQSWWANLGATVLLAVAIFGIIRYRTQRERLERERLEIAVGERSAELAAANRELQEACLRDSLTGVRNRRFLETTITADASQALRAYRTNSSSYSHDHRDLIFFLIDVDHFKEVNDRHGHHAGDRLLVQISERLSQIVRDSDFLIRWGGEEFLVVCRSAERVDAPRMAERILAAVGSMPFDLGGGCILRKTCSVGWAPFPWPPLSQARVSVDEVLRLADHGLYLSKQRGRNQATGVLPRGNLALAPGRYNRFEQLLTGGLIEESWTPGPVFDDEIKTPIGS